MPGPNQQPPQNTGGRSYHGTRVNKCWMTRKETSSFTIDGQTMYFESSIGIGIESDNPEHNSRDLYEAGNRALNILFERERGNWLSAKLAEAEKRRIDDELKALVPKDEVVPDDGVPDLTVPGDETGGLDEEGHPLNEF